jgi:hypothetical protein
MKRPLKHYSDEEIQQELAARAKENNKRPDALLVPDWSSLHKYVQSAVEQVHEDAYVPKDFEHYCFEMALEAVYGEDIWKWWNDHANG